MQSTHTDALYRTNDGPIAGVCGGIARKLGIDAGVMRMTWVVLTLLSGGALAVVYAALWLVLQREPACGPTPPVDVSPEAATSRCAQSAHVAEAASAAAGAAGAAAGAAVHAVADAGKRAAAVADRVRPQIGVVLGLVLGLVALSAGATLLLNQVIGGFSAWHFIPILAMAAGVARLAIPGRAGYSVTTIVEGAVPLVLGMVVLLSLFDIVHVRVVEWFADNWPLLLIILGLLMQARGLDSVALSVCALAVLALFFVIGFGFYAQAGAGADVFAMRQFGHGVRVLVLPGGSPV